MDTDAPQSPILDRDEWMRRTGPLYPGLVALRELTVLPVLRSVEPTTDDRTRAAPWFPAVGGLVGGLIALSALIVLATDLVPAIAGVLALVLALALTGGSFETGLARAVENLVAREDSDDPYGPRAIGMAGVAAIAASIALRVFLLLGIDPAWWVGAIITSQVVLRWVPVFLLKLGDRLGEPEVGRRSLLVGPVSWAALAIGSGFALLCAILFGGGVGLLALIMSAGLAFGAGVFFQRRYSGLSDTSLSAAAVACELVVLLVFAASHAAVVSPWVS